MFYKRDKRRDRKKVNDKDTDKLFRRVKSQKTTTIISISHLYKQKDKKKRGGG